MSGPESTKAVNYPRISPERRAESILFSSATLWHALGIRTGLEQCFEHRSKPKGLIELIFLVWREISGSMSRTARKRPKLSFDQKQKFWASEKPQRPLSFKEKNPDALSFSISAAFGVRRNCMVSLALE